MGVAAEFAAWLRYNNCISGEYGLKITATFASDESQKETITRIMYLDVKDMVGDPYAFESFYTQEKAFDISAFGGLCSFVVEFFQTSQSFYDINGNFISSKDMLDNDILSNLFVKNCHISLGYDVSGYNSEIV